MPKAPPSPALGCGRLLHVLDANLSGITSRSPTAARRRGAPRNAAGHVPHCAVRFVAVTRSRGSTEPSTSLTDLRRRQSSKNAPAVTSSAS